ncbi:uncharacterized protein LOC144448079 [Glandiceps talaboti]
MAHPMRQVLHEGDDAPDFFMTGDDEEWIDRTTEYMESNFKINGAHAARDFIGGPPILDQITEFVYTCRKTVVEFHSHSEWSNYTCRMVLHRMFQESQDNSKHRLIVVLRDKEAEKKLPKFLTTHSKLRYWETDFHWKLWNSIKGSSLRERTLQDQKIEEDEFNPSNNIYPMPDQVICSLPSSEPTSASTGPDIIRDGRFIPEDHLEQPGSEPGEMTPRPSSLEFDSERNTIKDKFYFEESPSTAFPIENLEGSRRLSDSDGKEKAELKFQSLNLRNQKRAKTPKDTGNLSQKSQSFRVKNTTGPAEAKPQERVLNKQEIHTASAAVPSKEGQKVKPVLTAATDSIKLNQSQQNVLSLRGEEGVNANSMAKMERFGVLEAEESSDTESAQHTCDEVLVTGIHSHDIHRKKDESIKNLGPNLLKELEEYKQRHQVTMEADKNMTQMKPAEFRQHQTSVASLGQEGTALIWKILKMCCEVCGMRHISSDDCDVGKFRAFLHEEGYISASFDQRLKMLKFDSNTTSMMAATVLQMPNAIITGQCIQDLKKLILKVFD